MKRIAKLMEGELLIKPDFDEEDESQASVNAMTEENAKEERHFFEHTATVLILTSLDESAVLDVESNGLDPYNFGRFESSKSRLKK